MSEGFLRLWAVVVVAVKRLLAQRWLTLATVLGLVIAVALAVSIPMYADAVYYRILVRQLSEQGVEGRKSRPPFAFLFRYVGAWKGPVDWDVLSPVDEYLSKQAALGIGLPQEFCVRYLATGQFKLFPVGDAPYADTRTPLAWVTFGFLSDLQDHVEIVEGGFPSAADPAGESVVEVLISESLAMETGLRVGESYVAFVRREQVTAPQPGVGQQPSSLQVFQIPIRVAGIWRPRDGRESYWFYDVAAFDDVLFVPEETLAGRIASQVDHALNLGVWYLVMDGSAIHSGNAYSLLTRILRVENQAVALLNGVVLAISPKEALQGYHQAVNRLTLLLYVFSIPIVVLILTFIGLVMGLAVGQRRGEIAVLRSRGATALQVVGIAALEGLLLGVAALIIGLPVGMGIAHIIGRTRSFLDFTLGGELRVAVTGAAVNFGLVAVALTLIAQIVPTIGAARHTIVTYKQERARALQRPWWQRSWLDVLLLIPAGYGVYMLKKGALNNLGGTDPFQNPLLLLVPMLGIFAFTLFLLRLLPTIISVVAWIISHTNRVGALLAARYLSRSPSFYSAPLILLVLTLSLSTYTASLAQTLDDHLHDQVYYRIGADMHVLETGEETRQDLGYAWMNAPSTTEEEEQGPRWLFLPVAEHLRAPGVQGAARIGRYDAVALLSGASQAGSFLGVDWWDFPGVAFWRSDFAPGGGLNYLMNQLATRADGVLVPRDFLNQHMLRVGDTLRLAVSLERRVEVDFTIVGSFDLFPTWYPESELDAYRPLFVGNLDYLFLQAGEEFPYDVWLSVAPDADYEQIAQTVRDLGVQVIGWEAPEVLISQEQERPERQGLFGVLSVGFLASALLTTLGFLLYTFFSFRRRFIELGVLRALGLPAGQMTAFLAWELAFLILTGALAGTGFGAWASRLFIPSLQIGPGAMAQVPPFVVQVAWAPIVRVYVLFGLLFFAALGGLAALLLRIKIFQAIKMGETV